MAKKWTDPLDRLIKADEKAQSFKEYLETKIIEQSRIPSLSDDQTSQTQKIVEMDVKKIIRWAHKDRPENELGDLEELAETFKTVGQQQPCILRPAKNHEGYYELIVGERRWRAAELAKIKLKCIICDIDDKNASIIQAIENEKRKDLSEFAKGISYADKIEQGFLTQKDLIEILGISKQQVSRLLSYRRIPEKLLNAISDFRKVSARTAEELARLSTKGEEYINLLIELAPKIRTGKCGHNALRREIEKLALETRTASLENQKVFSKDGRHLFTWRLDNNSTPSIHFPKDILKLFEDRIITFNDLTMEIKEWIGKKLIHIQN